MPEPAGATMESISSSPIRRLERGMRAWPVANDGVSGTLIALGGIGLTTLVLLPTARLLGEGDTALLYMPAIVVIAALGGVRAGLVSSLVGFFVAKFFFVPTYYSLRVEDPRDWVSLFVFVLVGLGMGIQTSRMQNRQIELANREQESSLLYRLSGVLALEPTLDSLCRRVVSEVAGIAQSEAALIFLRDGAAGLHLHSESGRSGHAAAAAALAARCFEGPDPWLLAQRILALRLRAEEDEGILCIVRADDRAPSVAEVGLYGSMAGLTATHIELQRFQQLAARTEGLREADRLKSNLVSSVSHELKTPLAIVTAIVTNLLESDVEVDVDHTRSDLRAAAEALARLNNSIGDLLVLSRLESGGWMPKREWCEVNEVLETVRRALPREQQARIRISLSDDLPLIFVDYVQWARMLGHVIENAMSYSGEAGVEVSARVVDGELLISVEDDGPGVDPAEALAVFDKFYRGSASGRLPGGTGLGLAISRDIVDFHQGRIWVTARQPHGACFNIALPLGEPPAVTTEVVS